MTESPQSTRTYFLVDDAGKERSFDAVDDSQATGLCQKRYPGQTWKLYRVVDTERIEVGGSGPARPGNSA